MRSHIFTVNLAATVVALVITAVSPPMAKAAIQPLGSPSSAPVVTITESSSASEGPVAADTNPKPCPNDAGQGTFNVDATLERRPWQDNHLGHAYWVELEARGAWSGARPSVRDASRLLRPAWL
jgi:hypothetical protein